MDYLSQTEQTLKFEIVCTLEIFNLIIYNNYFLKFKMFIKPELKE